MAFLLIYSSCSSLSLSLNPFHLHTNTKKKQLHGPLPMSTSSFSPPDTTAMNGMEHAAKTIFIHKNSTALGYFRTRGEKLWRGVAGRRRAFVSNTAEQTPAPWVLTAVNCQLSLRARRRRLHLLCAVVAHFAIYHT